MATTHATYESKLGLRPKHEVAGGVVREFGEKQQRSWDRLAAPLHLHSSD
jgi:hypothetical protein